MADTPADSGTMSAGGSRPQLMRVLSDIPDVKTKSGTLGTSANLVNSIVGAGIIAIPFAMRESGLVMGMLLLALVSWLTGKVEKETGE